MINGVFSIGYVKRLFSIWFTLCFIRYTHVICILNLLQIVHICHLIYITRVVPLVLYQLIFLSLILCENVIVLMSNCILFNNWLVLVMIIAPLMVDVAMLVCWLMNRNVMNFFLRDKAMFISLLILNIEVLRLKVPHPTIVSIHWLRICTKAQLRLLINTCLVVHNRRRHSCRIRSETQMKCTLLILHLLLLIYRNATLFR